MIRFYINNEEVSAWEFFIYDWTDEEKEKLAKGESICFNGNVFYVD